MMWRVVYTMAPLLSKEFRDAHQQLKNILTGSKKPEDLWKHCMSETNGAIGMALGAVFIKEAFEERSKVQVNIKRRFLQYCKNFIRKLSHNFSLCIETCRVCYCGQAF